MEARPQLPPWRNSGAREWAYRPYYKSLQEMPFHPWDHALVVTNVARAKALIARTRHDIPIDLDVLENGTLGHDTNVWLQPGTDYVCCPTKEQHSAHIEESEIAPKLEIPADKLEHILQVIRATERDVRCDDDLTAKCVCQGDMWSVIHEDSRPILLGTVNYFREQRVLADAPVTGAIDLEELTASAAHDYIYLQGFIEEELGLGPWDVDDEGMSPSQRGRKNIEQLRPEVFPNLMRQLFPDMLAA